jgi:hypothetical protein
MPLGHGDGSLVKNMRVGLGNMCHLPLYAGVTWLLGLGRLRWSEPQSPTAFEAASAILGATFQPTLIRRYIGDQALRERDLLDLPGISREWTRRPLTSAIHTNGFWPPMLGKIHAGSMRCVYNASDRTRAFPLAVLRPTPNAAQTSVIAM